MVQPSGEIGVGTVVADTYVVTRLIGQGGMGAVWAADHRRLPGKRVAIKVLLNAATDGESLARFRREAEIASRIAHANIVEVLDWNELPSGTPYMVLELLEGESLAQRLRRGPIELSAALGIVRQVASALHAAHRSDVVHRDLKPDNIFLCPTDMGGVVADRVKVLDFGISKIRGSSTVQTQDSALLGTPQYMAPEQAYGRNKTIDQRTDVWALGTIVFEMLTGRPAFEGPSLAHVLMSIVNDPVPSLKGQPGVPDAVVEAVARALEKEAEKRFDDVSSFVQALTGKPLETLDRQRSKDAFVATAAQAATPIGPTQPDANTPSPSARSSGVRDTEPSAAPATERGERSERKRGSAEPVARPPSSSGTLGTQPRGEVVTPPTHRALPGASKAPIYAGVAIALAGVGVAVWIGMAKKAPIAPAPNPVSATPPTAPAVKTPDITPPKPTINPPAPSPTPERKPLLTKAAEKAEKPVKATHEVLPPVVASDLDAAEKALAAGDAPFALHLARRTLGIQKSGRAFAIIARTYCQQGDLGNAKATLPQVPPGERGPVVRFCKKHDVDLK